MEQPPQPSGLTAHDEIVPGTKAYTVLWAARTIFLNYGFSSATTDMIQREAAVSKSTVYAHYANKEALFVAVVEAECHAFAETIRAIKFHPGQFKETLIIFGKAYLSVLLSESALALHRIIVAEGSKFPALARTFYQAGPSTIINMVSEILENALKSGDLDLGDVTLLEASKIFIHLVRSEPQFLHLLQPDYKPSPEHIERWINVAVNTFIRAYGKK